MNFKKLMLLISSVLLFAVTDAFCLEGFTVREESGFKYIIESAPEEYSEYIGTSVYYDTTFIHLETAMLKDIFPESCIDKVNNAFLENNFCKFTSSGYNVLCIYNPQNYMPFEEVKDFIYKTLSKKYAGFKDIKKKGFSKEIWEAVSDYDEMRKVLYEYMNDNHFYIYMGARKIFRREQVFDEGSVKSTDPAMTMFTKTTSNTYYIRCNDCDRQWEEYLKLPSYAYEACKKDFIVLDFRSNPGGSNYEQTDFFRNLKKKHYKGKIFVLQDNWSASSGEVWEKAGLYTKSLDVHLVGTHSAGMQMYGNVKTFKKGALLVNVPTRKFGNNLPSNYLGEGRGYEPEIWALTKDMKAVLEKEGLDLTGIEFK